MTNDGVNPNNPLHMRPATDAAANRKPYETPPPDFGTTTSSNEDVVQLGTGFNPTRETTVSSQAASQTGTAQTDAQRRDEQRRATLAAVERAGTLSLDEALGELEPSTAELLNPRGLLQMEEQTELV